VAEEIISAFKGLKPDSAIRTNNGMLMVPFWQTGSINRCLLIEHFVICSAEKV
jgi:hypothetical protein